MPTTVPELAASLAPFVGRSVVETQRRLRTCREAGLFKLRGHGRAAQIATDADAVTLLLAIAGAAEPIRAPEAVREFSTTKMFLAARHGGITVALSSLPDEIKRITGDGYPALPDVLARAMRQTPAPWEISHIDFDRAPFPAVAKISFTLFVDMPAPGGLLEPPMIRAVDYTKSFDCYFFQGDTEVSVIRQRQLPPSQIKELARVPGSVLTTLADLVDGRFPRSA
jgi:hypothetical protein